MANKKVKLKAKENYRGDGIHVKAGELFEVSADKAKQLQTDFPDKFTKPSGSKKKK
jgi:hypothetical protein|tara:strand:+ start:409 stop:576 length:168 start_codon:yes stop_codon:yes gene_type:complete